MVVTAVKERILRDLDKRSPALQEEAADLVHSLVTPIPPGTPISELHRFYGAFDPTSAEEMRTAIEEGCEQVDSDAR